MYYHQQEHRATYVYLELMNTAKDNNHDQKFCDFCLISCSGGKQLSYEMFQYNYDEDIKMMITSMGDDKNLDDCSQLQTSLIA